MSHYREGIEVAKRKFGELTEIMKANKTYEFNGNLYFDATNVPGLSFFVTDVSAYNNIPFISIRQKEGKRTGKVFLGNTSKKDIAYFLSEGCHKFGEVVDSFGDPRRHARGLH